MGLVGIYTARDLLVLGMMSACQRIIEYGPALDLHAARAVSRLAQARARGVGADRCPPGRSGWSTI